MTPNNRTEPGVCTRCGDTRLIPIGDGYSVNPCPSCAVQQPAQPGSGEVRRWNIDRDGDDLLICFDYHDKGEKCEYERYVPASALTAAQQRIADLKRLWEIDLTALTQVIAERDAAQQRITDLERDLENERARGIHTCHDQCQRPLCVAQRRIAELRGCLAELTALVNGESPALLNEDSGGDGELAVRIDNALEDPT